MDKPNFEHQNSDFEVKISAEDNYEVALLNNEGDPHNDDPSVQQKQNYDSMQDRNGQNSFNKTEDKKLKKLTYYPWTEQEEKLLLQLYQKHGPAWTKFVPLFHQKNETSIKNKFHRSFDKAVKTLHDHQKKVFRKLCRVTTNRTIGIILEISVQLRELILRQNFVVNPESLLFAYRNLFLKLCFMNSNFSKQQLTDLSNLGKAFNSKIKNLGVFRVKNIKSWKITESTIWTFCQIDRICLDQQTFIQKIFGNRAKKFVQMPLNVKMIGDEKQLADEQQGIDQDHNMEQDYHRHQQYATNYPHTEGTIKTEYFNNAYYYDYVPLLPMDYPYIYQYLMQNYAETRNNNIEIKQEANIETKRSDRQSIKIQQTGEIKIQFLNY